MPEYEYITGIHLPSHAASQVPLRLGHLRKLIQVHSPSVTSVIAHGRGSTSPDRVVVVSSATLSGGQLTSVLADFATMEADATLGAVQPATGRVHTQTFRPTVPHVLDMHGQKWRAPQDVLLTKITITADESITYDVPAVHMIADVVVGTYAADLVGMVVAGTVDLPSATLEVSSTLAEPFHVIQGQHVLPTFTEVAAATPMTNYTISVDYMDV